MERSTEEVKEAFKKLDLTTNKENYMTTLEMLLKEGEEIGMAKGEEIGMAKGEEIGINKGKVNERAFLSTINLLKIIHKFPNWTVAEMAAFTEIKPPFINTLLIVFKTKNKKNIQKVLDSHFLPDIELTKIEKAKINKLVLAILKQ